MPCSPRPAADTALPRHPQVALCGAAAAASLSIPQSDIVGKPRTQRVALARHIAIYLAHVGFALNYTYLGNAFGRDRTTIRHACGRIEDARDEISFDRALDFLEGALRLHADRIAAAGELQ